MDLNDFSYKLIFLHKTFTVSLTKTKKYELLSLNNLTFARLS